MSDNTSFLPSFSNASLPSSDCSGITFTAFALALVALVFPLFSVVLCLGCRRWRQQGCTSTAATSHSDVFTYHSVVMEMVMASWCLFYCFGSYSNASIMMTHGANVFFSAWSTKTHFHSLTCVEQYLAVVHPVSYLRLKHAGGVRVRNLSIVCVWLCFAGGIPVALTSDTANVVFYYCLVLFALIVVSFCCTSVLCVLRRPGPGRPAGSRARTDPKKRRAFLSIAAIMAALLLSLGGMLVGGALSDVLLIQAGWCVGAADVWFSLPSSVVLPLLYVQRAGRLPGQHDVA